MNDYSSTGNVNPDQIVKSMLKTGRKKVGKGSFRTAIGQEAHHSLPSQAVARVVGAGKSPFAPRSKANVGQSIAGSAATRGQQSKSLYKNPVIARRVPLDTSQVEDRRPRSDSDAAGGGIPYGGGRQGDRGGGLGMRPRSPKYVKAEQAELFVRRSVGGGATRAGMGAREIARPYPKKLPWGWSMPKGGK